MEEHQGRADNGGETVAARRGRGRHDQKTKRKQTREATQQLAKTGKQAHTHIHTKRQLRVLFRTLYCFSGPASTYCEKVLMVADLLSCSSSSTLNTELAKIPQHQG